MVACRFEVLFIDEDMASAMSVANVINSIKHTDDMEVIVVNASNEVDIGEWGDSPLCYPETIHEEMDKIFRNRRRENEQK